MSRVPCVLVALTLLAACGGDSTGTPSDGVATVTVTPENVSITKGGTTTLTAVARDGNGNVLTGKTFSWVSGTSTIASVSASGVVTGVNPGGPASISAMSEGISGFANVTVTQPIVASLDLTPATNTLTVGQTVQLIATPRDAAGKALPINVTIWGTDNDRIASVSSTGLVTAVGVGGPVNVGAAVGTVSAEVTVTVTGP